VSQLLVLTKPRGIVPEAGNVCLFRQTADATLVEAARLALGAGHGDRVFTVLSPSGDPFESWFDALPFDAERTNHLLNACAESFGALALFYSDHGDLEETSDLGELKDIVARQFSRLPVEICAAWIQSPSEVAS